MDVARCRDLCSVLTPQHALRAARPSTSLLRAQARKENPSLAIGPLQKVLSEKWKALSAEEAARYNEVREASTPDPPHERVSTSSSIATPLRRQAGLKTLLSSCRSRSDAGEHSIDRRDARDPNARRERLALRGRARGWRPHERRRWQEILGGLPRRDQQYRSQLLSG